MRKATLLALAGIFIVGVLVGFLATATLPDLALVNLYQQWGFLGLIGRVAIALMLLGIPLTYTAWIIGGIVQISRPHQPTENERLSELPEGQGEYQHVLVPAGGGPHALLGLRLATKLTNGTAKHVTLFRVIPPASESEISDQQYRLQQIVEKNLGPEYKIDIRVRVNDSVIHAIRDEVRTGDYDLLVIGASNRSTIASLLFGTIPDVLGEQITCPILVVRAGTS